MSLPTIQRFVCMCTWWSLKILIHHTKPIAVQFFNSLFAIHIQEIIDTEFAHLSIASTSVSFVAIIDSFTLWSLLCANHFHSIYCRALLRFFFVCYFIRYDWLRWQFVLFNQSIGCMVYVFSWHCRRNFDSPEKRNWFPTSNERSFGWNSFQSIFLLQILINGQQSAGAIN